MVTVRYFAAARELAGCDSEEIELDAESQTQDAFRALLGERHPRLGAYLARMRLALDGDFISSQDAIRNDGEVDILPPVAGGSGSFVDLRQTPLSVDEVLGHVAHAGAGGIALFVGVVRDNADGKNVSRLDYEAHPELALKEMRRVLQGVESDFPGTRLAATHRFGQLAVGDLAVVVAASAAHRAQAFDACRAAIDRIKETVPIWKREWDAEGIANWVNLEST